VTSKTSSCPWLIAPPEPRVRRPLMCHA
jgi:hypothetical protein